MRSEFNKFETAFWIVLWARRTHTHTHARTVLSVVAQLCVTLVSTDTCYSSWLPSEGALRKLPVPHGSVKMSGLLFPRCV